MRAAIIDIGSRREEVKSGKMERAVEKVFEAKNLRLDIVS